MRWKAGLRRMINSFLEPSGFTLRRYNPELHYRAMKSTTVRKRQIEAFQRTLIHSLKSQPELAERIPDYDEINEFLSNLNTCPVHQDSGGGGVSTAVLIFAICKMLQPELIVESGVFRGFTTWVLRQASPQARQFAFDISFAERQGIVEGVEYYESDWMNVDIDVKSVSQVLAYFDDHVDQWRRIREASQRGFKNLLFDDSLPSTALHNDGQAAVPTVDMLFEDYLTNGEEILWQTECGKFEYKFDMRAAEETRLLIYDYIRLPDLRFIFGYVPANLVLVILR